MKKRLLTVLSLVLALTLVLSACGGNDSASSTGNGNTNTNNSSEGNSNEGGGDEIITNGVIPASDPSKNPAAATNRTDTVIIGMTAPNGIFNPLFAETTYDVYVASALFDSLVKIEKDGSYSPQMADYEVSEDGLVYTFTLKDGIKWTDGTPVTAKDIAFSRTLLFDSSYDGPTDVMQSAPIKGGQDYKDGKATSISGIKVVNDKTIEFTMDSVNPLALATLGSGVIPEHYYGKDYKQGNLGFMKDLFTKPLGNGAYILKKFAPGQEVVMEANPDYYAGAPKVKNLIYKVTTDETLVSNLQTGETDMDFPTASKDQIEDIKAMGFLDTQIFPTNGYGYIAMNHNDPKFKDQKVRQALTYGLDRQQIVDAVYQGYAKVINVPQSDLSWSYTDEGIEKYDFDLEKAKQLLDEAGWVPGADGIREKDGVKFKINFAATSPNPVNDAIIPIATANYKELGIDFVAEQMDFNAVIDKRKKGDFDMLFMAWGLTPDPQSMQNVYMTSGSQNDIGYSNAKIDELFKKTGSTVNQEERKELFKQVYQEMNADLPYIYLYQRSDMWSINNRVKGFDLSPYKDFTSDLNIISVQ